MNPCTDTAQMMARLLFQTHQIPLTIDDVRTALGQKTNLLKHTLELNGKAIEQLKPLMEGCADAAQLAAAIRQSGGEALRSILLACNHLPLQTSHGLGPPPSPVPSP